MNSQRILITGVSGLLGSNLAYCFRGDYQLYGLYHTHRLSLDRVPVYPCDLREKSAIEEIVRELRPDVIIHCAALTNVDICEEDIDLTEQMNVLATKNIVHSMEDRGIKLIYISTDLVYDGKKGHFSENDPVGPPNAYACSKLRGEQEALKVPGALVLRTNFFGWSVFEERSLGEWVIRNLMAREKIKGFTDAVFSSIYTFDLADIMDRVIRKGLCGIYNLGSKNSCSKYDFAVMIARQLGLDASLILPASIDDFDFKAKRSKNLSLDVRKIENDAGVTCGSIEGSVKHFAEDFKMGKSDQLKAFAKRR